MWDHSAAVSANGTHAWGGGVVGKWTPDSVRTLEGCSTEVNTGARGLKDEQALLSRNKWPRWHLLFIEHAADQSRCGYWQEHCGDFRKDRWEKETYAHGSSTLWSQSTFAASPGVRSHSPADALSVGSILRVNLGLLFLRLPVPSPWPWELLLGVTTLTISPWASDAPSPNSSSLPC